MSKIFYDHLIVLEEIDIAIRGIAETSEEREEIWKLVDEIIHQRVLSIILTRLPQEHHKFFLEKFYETPYDDALMSFLQERMSDSVEHLIREEVLEIQKELIKEMEGNGDEEE